MPGPNPTTPTRPVHAGCVRRKEIASAASSGSGQMATKPRAAYQSQADGFSSTTTPGPRPPVGKESWGIPVRLAHMAHGYNREVQRLLLLASAILLAACAGDIQNTEAVRQGVLEYLNARTAQTGLDMNLMQVTVSSVSFQGGTEAR